MKKITYADSGVDITEGNRAVELMKAKVKETYTNGVVGDIGLFAGGFSLGNMSGMEEPVLLASTDGVGTKIMIAQQMDVHDTVGIDLVAMCVNDLIKELNLCSSWIRSQQEMCRQKKLQRL